MKRSRFIRLAALSVLSLFILGGVLSAQSDPDAVGAYQARMQTYKDHLKELRSLKEEYQTAAPERKDEIQAKFNPLLAETSTLQKSLVPLAIEAFKSLDSQDEELSVFLMSMLDKMVVTTEEYETAYSIAKALDGAIPEQYSYLYAYGAYAAFNVMQLDDAEAFYQKAKETGGLEGLRKQDPRGEMQIPSMITQVLPQYRKLWPEELAAREKDAAEELPRVLLRTSKGDIVLELFLREAPESVGNFMTLVSQKYYDGVPFHRVLPHFMAQGGDPTGTGAGGPGYCIKDECKKPGARMHFRGSLSMAKTAAPDSGGSQFFLCFIPTVHLNGQHTVFGRVVEGMEVLSELQRINPEGRNLPAPDRIVEARILRGEPTPFTKLREK
ncbi:MAG: peptidylprolyl isomerase [Thermoguttaceae bacterium]|nr:peptidylprolyl isomerase [Thermoguttaceae bacterium]